MSARNHGNRHSPVHAGLVVDSLLDGGITVRSSEGEILLSRARTIDFPDSASESRERCHEIGNISRDRRL
jgi:hypothetical protein